MANSPSGDSMTQRVVRVLETFTPTRTVQTTSEIGRRAGLAGSTAHRIVADMVDAGLLERDDARRVRVGMRLWALATRSSYVLHLRQTALPFMARVQSRVREHTQLAVLEQDEALFVERLSGAGSGANITRIAGRLPLHASSPGLVLLAFGAHDLQDRVLSGPLTPVAPATPVDPAVLRRELAHIRAVGHAVAPGYIEDVSTGVAVPVRGSSGRAVAAISVVLPRGAETTRAIAELRRAARDIERSLGSPW